MVSTTELTEGYNRLRIYTFCMVAILIAAACAVFFKPVFSLLILAAALIYHIVFLRKRQKEYTSFVTAENLRRTTMEQLEAKELFEKSGGSIDRETIRTAGLIPMDDGDSSALLMLGMAGKMKGMDVSVCDATIAESFSLTEKGKKRVHHNAGAWFHIRLKKDTGLNLRILHEDAVPLLMKKNYYQMKTDLLQIPSSKIALPSVFYTYTDAGSGDDINISMEFIHKFLELSEYTPGKLAVSIQGDRADVFLRGRFFGMPVTLKKMATDDSLSFDPMPELKKIVQMVGAL